MLTQKPIFLAYPSESSPSFQNPHSRCPLDLSLVLDEWWVRIFYPHSVFNSGCLIEFMCLKSDLIDNSDN